MPAKFEVGEFVKWKQLYVDHIQYHYVIIISKDDTKHSKFTILTRGRKLTCYYNNLSKATELEKALYGDIPCTL